MKVASTMLIVRESKNEVLKIGVANNKTNNNGANNKSNSNVAHKLGMVQVNQKTIDQMFDGDGATNGGGKIKSIEKNLRKSSPRSLMTYDPCHLCLVEMNSSPDKYKEVQDIMAQKSEVETDKITIAQ